ncbi:MAG: hypothetical protein KDB22_26780, partial [Planctomycetales bacterium]|nr:hypothetical protein [Planctomycetales bacterium]
LALGELHYGDSVPQRLVVKGPKAFKILEITSPEVEVGFSPIVEAKPNHLLNLNISPKSSRPGKVKGRLVIETDLMDEPTQLGVTYELLSPEGTSPEPNIEVQAAN